MNRSLISACAAVMLVGTLTACSSAPANNSSGGTNDAGTGGTPSGGTPSGTSYSVPRSTQYPNGANQDRESYGRMTSNRTHSTASPERRPDSRYTAYSDGYVYPGNSALNSNSGPGPVHDMARSARHMVSGVGDMFRDAGDAVRSMTGMGTASQRMDNDIGNTVRNANAE